MSGPWEKYQSEDQGPWAKYSDQPMGGSPPLGFVAKQIWDIAPQNPKNLLKNLPLATGALGGVGPIVGGTMLGTGIGQGIRYLGDKLTGQEIPSPLHHLAEMGGAAVGDVLAFPAINKSFYGKQIGAIEKAQGVPAAQDIPSIPMATGAKSAGDFINEAVDSVKSSGGQGTPSYWLQIKDQVDRLYKMGKDQALTNLDKGRLKWLSGQVQEGLNASVPGRSIPADALAKSQTIPRMIGKGFNMIPQKVRSGLGYGTGVVTPAIIAEELIRRAFGK